MRYVIIRDDDTNALTPPEYLERLYRPFLDRSLPVNLAVIPAVRTTVTMPDGRPEGFLITKKPGCGQVVPIAENAELVRYLSQNPGFRIAQHGLHHDYFEFDSPDAADMERRIEKGASILAEAGLRRPEAFVAPYDKFSAASLKVAARRFRVISSGWYERQRLPLGWWPQYLLKKLAGADHWDVGGTKLLTHPGCLLSCYRCYETMFDDIRRAVESRPLTVLVTHWWEYFRNGYGDEEFIHILHRVGEWLASSAEIRVIGFGDVVNKWGALTGAAEQCEAEPLAETVVSPVR